jgi:pyrophosphatase PpaX
LRNPLLFDLDGTLIDSIPLILASFRHTLVEHLGAAPSDAELVAGIGTPLRTQLARYTPDSALVEALFRTYKAHNEAHHDAAVRAFDGVHTAVAALRDAGRTLGVVTSKARPMALRGLEVCGLAPYFSVVVALEDSTRHKPEPDPVERALAHLGASAHAAVYVGDSPHDLLAGRRAGVETAAAAWGPFSAATLRAEAPDLWFEGPADLLRLLERRPSNQA